MISCLRTSNNKRNLNKIGEMQEHLRLASNHAVILAGDFRVLVSLLSESDEDNTFFSHLMEGHSV